jgi:hypothetical protein
MYAEMDANTEMSFIMQAQDFRYAGTAELPPAPERREYDRRGRQRQAS